MVDIIKTKFGIANYYSSPERIEINERLFEPEFENLKNHVIQHELEHHRAKSKGFWKQREIDLKTSITFKDIFPFIKKHPKAFFQQYFPFSYRNKTLYLEWSLIFFYLLCLGFAYLIYLLINTFSDNNILFWKIIKNILIVGFIVGVLTALGRRAIKGLNKQSKELKK
jgi:hypothetical protein